MSISYNGLWKMLIDKNMYKKDLAAELNIPMRVLTADVLSSKKIVDNPSDRCYYCKRMIFETIVKAAAEDGFSVLLDGTNASDDAGGNMLDFLDSNMDEC